MTEQIKIDFEKTIKASDFSKSDAEFKKSFLNKFIAKGFPSKKSEELEIFRHKSNYSKKYW